MSEPEVAPEVAPGVKVGDDGHTQYVPRRVQWKAVNLQGWQECQFDGFVAATRHGMDRHEAIFHGGDEGVHAVVLDLEGRLDETYSMLAKLPRRAGLRLFPWGRRR